MEPGENPSAKLLLFRLSGLREIARKPPSGAGGRFPRGTTLIPAAAPQEGRARAGTGAAPARPRGPRGPGAALRREWWEAPKGGGAGGQGHAVRAGTGTPPRAAAAEPRRRTELEAAGGSGAPYSAHHRAGGGSAHPRPPPRAVGISGWVLRHIRAAEMPVRRAGGGGGLGAPPGLAALCGAREPSGPGSGGGRPGPPHRRAPPLTATDRPPQRRRGWRTCPAWGRGAALAGLRRSALPRGLPLPPRPPGSVRRPPGCPPCPPG